MTALSTSAPKELFVPTTVKITTWNIKGLDSLLAPSGNAKTQWRKDRRKKAIAEQVAAMAPDVLCVQEGPRGEAKVDAFAAEVLGGHYVAVKAGDGEYDTRGRQWIWFLVRPELAADASLLPIETWDAFAGRSWTVNYWGGHESGEHRHYRHPQTLVLEVAGARVEVIGVHMKSKFVRKGPILWEAGGAAREKYVEKALKARIKLATEAANVRAYIDAKFEQVANPAILVVGDMNDGPGKEHLEDRYLFFDLLSNLQGDVFFARRFLNHALFDGPDHLRWTVDFGDFIDPDRDPHILLDHILFTQALVDGSLPLRIRPGAGLVEHEVHELVNTSLPKYAETSDHRPVSVMITVDE